MKKDSYLKKDYDWFNVYWKTILAKDYFNDKDEETQVLIVLLELASSNHIKLIPQSQNTLLISVEIENTN